MGLVIPHMPSRLYPMGASRPRPYDAEVEYLEGDGASYIDTGVKINTATDVVTVKYYQPSESTSTNPSVFGCFKTVSGTTYRYTLRKEAGSSTVMSAFFPKSTGYVGLPVGSADDSWHTFSIWKNNYTYDGTAGTFESGYNLEFSHNLSLFALTLADGNHGQLSKCRIASFSVTRNGVCILDLIPVRVGTTGYMYDRVSGRLFGNAGTGAFVVGPDKKTAVDAARFNLPTT